MRVSIFTDGFPPYISGVTTAAVTQAAHLAKRGHEVMVVSPSPPSRTGRLLEEGRIQVDRLALSVRWPFLDGLWLGVPTLLKSIALLKAFAPDIVHLHSEGGTGLEGLLAGRRLGLPVVGNFSTLFAHREYLRSYHVPSSRFFQGVVWRYQTWFFNSCDLVIAPSRSARDLLLSRRLGRTVEVVSNGIAQPQPEFNASVKSLRQKYGCCGTFNLIYVGRVSREKSLQVALAAFDRISERHTNMKFVIIGSGNYASDLRRHVGRVRNPGRYILIGEVPHDDLIHSGLFRLGDVFVMPSKTETEGIAMREAMAFGLPVIAVAANATQEVVDHTHNGFLVAPDSSDEIAERLDDLLNSPEMVATMGHNAATSASGHFADRTVLHLERIYASVGLRTGLRRAQP